ncbi:MAG TPA: GNAT family protein [Ramlibacter sp.]|uniref:GNAT family N-acetyltransferase n=1 Tax=Ramlibacter sp. TaxID=1917967 RepID=UPI002ED49670
MAAQTIGPLAQDLPLQGELVEIRAFGPEDLTPEYVGWLNDPEVVRYSNQRFRRHDARSCAAYLESFPGTGNLFLSVRRKDGRHAIGTMTVYHASHHGTADVGILIGDRNAWGRGYGQDAWNTVVHWLARHPAVRKVTAGTVACNAGMLKLMERSGMKREAVRERQELIDGEPVDIVYFAKHRDD